MVMLCFLLDLRTLSPPLLRDLKQSLLQLANFYAITSPRGCKSLLDRIGVCYVFRDRVSASTEMKVAYRPSGNFSLRDFHHAVNNLPADAFVPEFNNNIAVSCCDVHISSVLSDKVLYSWGDNEDVGRKVIVISSCLLEDIDSLTKIALLDAADKCVSVDFVLLEKVSGGRVALSESIDNFNRNICDLENCSFRNHLSDAKVLCALVREWLKDLRDEAEQLQARLKFKRNILGSLNQICCNLFPSFNHIIDEFEPCQVCRCHGYPLDDERGNKSVKSTSCPVTGNELAALDLIRNCLKVGEHTVLLMPSFHYYIKLQHVTSPIDFNIIERTNLGSLSEGLIVGTPIVVVPSTSNELDDTDQAELNSQVFQGLCSALHCLDQGLVCSSRCNTETMRETSVQCYYILLPSNNGVMLLRRLAGSEEVIPIPDVSQSFESTEAKDIRDSVKASVLEIEVRNYNPIQHERGFHQKLNVLVKESLHFGSLPAKSEELPPEPTSTQGDPLNESETAKQAMGMVGSEEEIPQLDFKSGRDKITERITEEWEQLIVNEIPKISSPTCVSKPKLDHLAFTPIESSKPLDEKTSRILERLEIPRKLKSKLASPVITSSSAPVDSCMLTKRPLIPFQPTQTSDTGTVSSQPMRPNFQRLKRKNIH
nr:sperm protamine like [Tanacetum cinerariifolium]